MSRHEGLRRLREGRRYLRARRLLLGNRRSSGLFFKAFVYVMLVSLGFIYLYPLLYMLVTSVKSLPDLLDVSVNWVPTALSLDNFTQAIEVLRFRTALWDTIQISVLPAVCQTIACALTGYAFARYRFPLRRLAFALVLMTFVLPPYALLVPKYTMFSDYKLLGSLGTLVLPAILGQGMNSAIFILVFAQFFKQTPLSLDEAARVDGAGETRIFLEIALPLSVPAVVVSLLFSLVWYWNETYFLSLYLGSSALGKGDAMASLLVQLSRFEQSYLGYMQSLSQSWSAAHLSETVANEAIRMAATLISILPLLLIYLVLQKQFVQSIDRTGITGE